MGCVWLFPKYNVRGGNEATMIPNKKFVFIIGAPRSGTTWLQAMVAAHPFICSTIDELKLFDLFTVPLERGWQYLLNLQKDTGGGRYGLTAMWTDREFYEFLGDFVGRIYTQVLAMKPEATILVDKAPAYSNCVEHIDRLIPQAKFIHMIRDGRDVAVSLIAAAQGWGGLWAPKKVKVAASAWKSYVLAAQKARQYRQRYVEVRYEDLLTNGVQVLRQIFEFMDVPTNTQNVAAIYQSHQFENMKRAGTGTHGFALPQGFFRKGQAGDWRNSLTPGQRYAFDERAGDLLCTLGYTNNASWWYDHAYQRFTAPLAATLSSRSRMQMQTIGAIRRVLGPQWINRLRAVRARGREKNTIEIPPNG
jgi:LPS sulfotransferase NodH